MSRRRDAVRDDDGSALVETIVVLCVFLAPLVWVAIALLRVEAGAYAVRAAARESARAYVTSASSAQGEVRAQTAARLAYSDQGVSGGHTSIGCSTSPCLTPGGSVSANSSVTIPLPFVPSWLAGPTHLRVTLASEHSETVERYGGTR